MSKVLVIGAGGVGSVAVHKMAMNGDIFSDIHLASRTQSKCDAIAESVKARTGVTITTYALDADDVAATTALLNQIKPKLLVNLALPYQDLHLMDACLAAGVDYMDTANYEPIDEAKFEYKWQWAYQDRFKDAGLMALLGSGFDPDLTGRENVFLNGAILGYTEEFLKEKFDEIHEFSELGDFIDVPIRNYSSGMMARLAFSVATVVNPQILIVDEILSVGDESFQAKSRARMMELMSGGTTVLFVSHSLSQIREMCDHVLWLDSGEVKMYGETQEVCDAYSI